MIKKIMMKVWKETGVNPKEQIECMFQGLIVAIFAAGAVKPFCQMILFVHNLFTAKL